MTLQASSQRRSKTRPFRPWAHAFGQALREGWVIALLSTVVYVAVIVSTVVYFSTQQFNSKPLTSDYRYILFHGPSMNAVLPVIMLIISTIQGVYIFRMMFSRSAAGAWYSLGLSRKDLFWARFLAGLIEVVLPIFIAMTLSLTVNLTVFPDSGYIVTQWLKMLCGLLVQAAGIYSIVAAVCAVTGTVAECLCYSVIVVCAPTALLTSLNALAVRFLFGNGIGVSENYWSSFNPELILRFADVNPLLFMYKYVERYASESTAQMAMPPVSALPIVFWLVAVLLIVGLAYKLFTLRRVETTGKMSTGKLFPAICIFVVSGFAFAVPFMLTPLIANTPNGLLLLFGCLIATVAFAALALPLQFIGKQAWRGALTLPAGLAISLAVVGVLYSGCFGYSTFVPDPKDVTSVFINYNGIPAYEPKQGGFGYSTGWINYHFGLGTVKLSDEADIAVATGLHREIIKEGKGARVASDMALADKTIENGIHIEYMMKNGQTVTRYYSNPSTRLLAEMLTLDATKGSRDLVRQYVTGEYGKKNRGGFYAQAYTDGRIYLSSRFNADTKQIDLTAEKRAKLLESIADDIAAQSVEERYYPKKSDVCVLRFADRESGFEQNGLPQYSQDIYITDGFEKTLALLSEAGLIQTTTDISAEVESLRVYDYARLVEKYTYSMYSPLFISSVSNEQGIQQYENEFSLALYIVDDRKAMDEILTASHMQYFTSEDGYLVLIKYKGIDRFASVFLPAADAPDFVKDTVK